jgi:DNA modification methylase
MAAMEPDSVSCCVTSPPYWGLRKYEVEPTIWGGSPDCPHRLEAVPTSAAGYAGRQRWQHEGVSRQETPEAWESHGSRQQRNRNKQSGSTLRDGTGEPWTEGTALLEIDQGGTCALCGGWRGHYGCEPSISMYVEHTIEVLRAIRRVLRADGCVWWDIDDSRGGSGKGSADQHPGPKQATNAGSVAGLRPTREMPKSLCLIPQRVAIAAQEDGWTVRSQIVIPSWMPESAKDRPTDAYRVLLMLTRSKKYWSDFYAVRVASCGRDNSIGPDNILHNLGIVRPDGDSHTALTEWQPDGLRWLGNVWDDIPPAAHPSSPSFRHFATMPLAEAERCILAKRPRGHLYEVRQAEGADGETRAHGSRR